MQCQYCNLEFKSRQGLWEHKKIKHPTVNGVVQTEIISSLKCKYCPKILTSKQQKNYHQKTQHGHVCKTMTKKTVQAKKELIIPMPVYETISMQERIADVQEITIVELPTFAPVYEMITMESEEVTHKDDWNKAIFDKKGKFQPTDWQKNILASSHDADQKMIKSIIRYVQKTRVFDATTIEKFKQYFYKDLDRLFSQYRRNNCADKYNQIMGIADQWTESEQEKQNWIKEAKDSKWYGEQTDIFTKYHLLWRTKYMTVSDDHYRKNRNQY